MAEENITTNKENETGMEADYIAQIQELKNNSVSREAYEAMREENRKLLTSLVNGTGKSAEEPAAAKKSIEELRKNLFNSDSLSNLEYCKTAVELRDRLIEEGHPDPFLPSGKNIVATDEDIACANRVAAALKQCIDYADGDSAIFTNELQRITVDTAPHRR